MKRLRRLILTNEDKVLNLVKEAASTLDLTCVNHDDQDLDIWITEPDEFTDDEYGKLVENYQKTPEKDRTEF